MPAKARHRSERTRAPVVRAQSSRHSRRAMATARELSPLAELIHALQQEGIRLQIAGMSAAILQGAPATTLDTDIWVDLPSRAYMRVHEICRRLGANILAQTAVALRDDTLVNFLYHVDGLRSFQVESRKAVRLKWQGLRVDVLPLESIIKSKSAIRRPKDIAHLPLLQQTLKLRRKQKSSPAQSKNRRHL